jgi:hypothetical protein
MRIVKRAGKRDVGKNKRQAQHATHLQTLRRSNAVKTVRVLRFTCRTHEKRDSQFGEANLPRHSLMAAACGFACESES